VPGLVEQLTARELEILALLAAGTTNPPIAEELVVTLDTVKSTSATCWTSLGAANRTEAVTRARQLGLIRPPAARPCRRASGPAAEDSTNVCTSG
jgi:LuxR family maltose regulon positive regulatory protein